MSLALPTIRGYEAALSADGARLALEREGSVEIWDVDQAKVFSTLKTFHTGRIQLAFRPESPQLALLQPSGSLDIWNLETGAVIHSLALSSNSILPRQPYSGDGRLLMIGNGKEMLLLNSDTMQATGKILADERIDGNACISADGKLIAAKVDSGNLGLFNAEAGNSVGFECMNWRWRDFRKTTNEF